MNLTESSNGYVFKNGRRLDLCVKCSKTSAFIGQSKTPYCEECYLILVKGKFRSTISKRRILKDRERKVLVILNGSKESAFLFRQVEDAMKQTNFKRLILEPSFIFLLSADMTDVRVVEEHLAVLRRALPGSYKMVHLAAIFGDIHMLDDGTCSGLQYLPQLKEFLASFRTAVSREEAVRILKVRVLQKLSRLTEVPKVMLPCNSDELAQLMISQLCLGRGGSVSRMTDVVEKTRSGTIFIRPLRDITSAEIATALRLENVENYALPEREDASTPSNHLCEASKTVSLQEMSSKFLNHFVEEGFEGTIPTVLGISNKIHPPVEQSCCSICDYPVSGKEDICYACTIIKNNMSPSLVHYLCYS
ncbi:unnamed protein product [Cylicocyclus nassatus]|uniref:Cytoplasmic tRNA 2-thiolation protein 2 n=1 Tax=Cylicocyclus nassatus TaxID=53992 RepID=A0AA36MGS2_CYLNA|nr:unnamed protein product [Cylicocyclus nassatus]